MLKKIKGFVLLGVLLLSGCNSLPYKGTVQYQELEGGFFGIISDKGESILPLNLNDKFKKDGIMIEFSGEYDTEIMTMQQWGKPFVIDEIKLL